MPALLSEKKRAAACPFERNGLGLQLLRMTGAHGELAFKGDDFRRARRRADNVPEGSFAGRRGDADAGRSAVDIVGHVRGLDVSRQRADAAALRLGEALMIGQAVIGQQILQRTGAAPKPQGIDRQHRDIRGDVVAAIAGGLVAAGKRFAHDHPQGITGRRAVARREHELVAVGMLGATVVEPESTSLWPGQMRDHVERRIGQRSAKMPGLGIVAEPHERHARQEAHVFHAFPVALLLAGR